ncbi:MAG: ATPase, T2SS/T4P/T4SS family [Mariprofundaceae bacterium]|nr:ATPase, T2SS/T4P/T4SS family [Mariprofundaceae bacterium]
MNNLLKVRIHKADGTCFEGNLSQSFNQNASQITWLDSLGKKQTTRMKDIECIMFLNNEEITTDKEKPGVYDVIERVVLKSGARFIIFTNSLQIELNGFFAYLKCPEDRYVAHMFFVANHVLSRRLTTKFGKLLEEVSGVRRQSIQAAAQQQQIDKQQRIGDILVKQGVSTRQTLEKAIALAGKPKMRKQVGDMLLQEGIITQEQLNCALIEQKHCKQKKIGDILIENGVIDETTKLSCLAKQLRVQFVDLSSLEPEPNALLALGGSLARELHIIPMTLHDKLLKVATSEPNDLDVLNQLQFHTSLRIHLVLASKSQIENKLDIYYNDKEAELEVLEQEFSEKDTIEKSDDILLNEAEQPPVVRLVNRILKEAIQAKASDIHVLSGESEALIEFRINGKLSEHLTFTQSILTPIITRFKILARMDISEHRLPQDGRIRIRFSGRHVEFRVSCIPSIHGETLVCRVLDKQDTVSSLDNIGMSQSDLSRLKDICLSDYGLVLITGPTGSGKSTTMVCAISEQIGQGKRLISLEDPVETEIKGVLQVQINNKINFTFARALRNLLRHDPNIIMVGEIRDGETAKVALEAALTGHLLFSSLHTNTAAGAFARMINMGAEAYLVAATVKGVMSQRLLPRNCDHCREQVEISHDTRLLLEQAGHDSHVPYYIAKGCSYCHETGLSGRVLVYELIQVNAEIETLIVEGAPEGLLQKAAEKNGMRPISQLAIDYAQAGDVDLQYVLPLLMEFFF